MGANTPASDLVDIATGDGLQVPVVNIGPWGRDHHRRLERLCARYAVDQLPHWLDGIVSGFLRTEDGHRSHRAPEPR